MPGGRTVVDYIQASALCVQSVGAEQLHHDLRQPFLIRPGYRLDPRLAYTSRS